jgi:hypothetical protein
VVAQIAPGRSSLERSGLCHRCPECIGLCHDHLSDGPIRPESAGGEHDAGVAVVRYHAGRLSSDPAAPHCRPPAMDAAQFCAVLFDRGLQIVFTGAEVDPADVSQAIGVTSWLSWVVNLLIVEWWLHRRRTFDRRSGDGISQPSSNRIRTRGNPPETESVSAALVKPESSKSLRVPT